MTEELWATIKEFPNYEISNWIKEHIKDDRLIFHNPDDREDMLEKHLKNKK